MPVRNNPPVLCRPPARAVRDVYRMDPDGTWAPDNGQPGLAFSFRDFERRPFTCSDNRWGYDDNDAPERFTVDRWSCSNGADTAETEARNERLRAEPEERDRVMPPPRVGDRFRYRTDANVQPIIYEVLAVLDVEVRESGTTWMTVLRTGQNRHDWFYKLASDQGFKGMYPTFTLEH